MSALLEIITYINKKLPKPYPDSQRLLFALPAIEADAQRTRGLVRVRRKNLLIDHEAAHGPVPRYPTANPDRLQVFPCPRCADPIAGAS